MTIQRMDGTVNENDEVRKYLIAAEHLSLGYGSAAPVVSDVSFSIAPGEILCVVGESGSGKSTLLKAIMNPEEFGVKICGGKLFSEMLTDEKIISKQVTDEGGIGKQVVDDEKIGNAARRGGNGQRRVGNTRNKRNDRNKSGKEAGNGNTGRTGMIFQNSGASFNPIRTYRKQFRETLKSNGLFRDEESWQEVLQMLDSLGLADGERILDSCPYEMSGGMNQRIAIALTMLLRPRLILADEPTSALDVTLQEQVLDELLRARELYGTAILLVTHNLGVAAKMADRIAVMREGRFVECRSVKEVLHSPEDVYTKELLAAVPRIPENMRTVPPRISEEMRAVPPRILENRQTVRNTGLYSSAESFDLQAVVQNATKSHSRFSGSKSEERGCENKEKNEGSYTSPILEVRHLGKIYHQGRRDIHAVRDISFAVREGEFLGIVGESGSGKSTLLRQIAGLEKPDGGEILFGGGPLAAKRTKEDYRRMQMIFQEPIASFDPRIRIGKSILENQKNLCREKMRRCRIKKTVDETSERILGNVEKETLEMLLAQTGLSVDLKDRYPSELSGGQCQRAAISRAIAVHPKVLLCDEITSALDVSVQARIIELLVRLVKERGMAVVFVSHDLALVSTVCSHVLVMKDGVCVEYQETGELLRHPLNEYTKQLLGAVL
ncbi:MAG: ABC transporter ATP-binding protein [Clostridiales bacterium]|nr:ABC transporter ATP-binding protein [Clostridiales bacterium]